MIIMLNTTFIEQLRQNQGYTQEQIAIMLGYNTQAAYSKKIKDAKRFTIDDIIALCRIYNVEPNQLIIIEKVGK